MFCKALSRLLPAVEAQSIRAVVKASPSTFNLSQSTRCLSYLTTPSQSQKFCAHQLPCSCGCSTKLMHTKGDQELAKFLQQEIGDEKKTVVPGLPSMFDGFSIKCNEAQMILTKKYNDETITITLDVNHSVDADSDAQMVEGSEEAELKSRPSFEVDVAVQSRVLSFTCSFHGVEDDPGHDQNVMPETFGINEVTVYEGEWKEEVYCVAGDILDAQLYDHFMNYLEERGVTDEFAEKLSELCSEYEHSLYVGLLEKVLKFVLRK
ncbi:Mitochondrial glycoprotein [Trinorchestia longiramus]|nr:Mitochondrial glycoprotein [Trinorchestia longiramus]